MMLEVIGINSIHPFLSFLLLAVTGIIFGRLAEKIKLPDISGQIIAGILLGPYVWGLFSHADLKSISFFNDFALGIMTFIIGTHLNLNKLHNSGMRIFNFAISDVIITFILVFSCLYYLGNMPLTVCILASAIAIETAPGTIIGLVVI